MADDYDEWCDMAPWLQYFTGRSTWWRRWLERSPPLSSGVFYDADAACLHVARSPVYAPDDKRSPAEQRYSSNNVSSFTNLFLRTVMMWIDVYRPGVVLLSATSPIDLTHKLCHKRLDVFYILPYLTLSWFLKIFNQCWTSNVQMTAMLI